MAVARAVDMRSITLAIVLALTGVLPGTPAPAEAYEADIHYAWTYYLALHVGYTKRQAYQVASAAYAVDESPTTSPMEATPGDVVYGARHSGLWGNPHPKIAEIWARFHAFIETNYRDVPGMVEEGRRKRAAYLWNKAKGGGNPGLLIHYIQDYHSHFLYDNVRGHVEAGHGPDFPGTDYRGVPDPRLAKDKAMTRDTVYTLVRFMQDVLFPPTDKHPFIVKQRLRLPRTVDLTDASFLWPVFAELVQANPAPMSNPLGGLAQIGANYNPSVRPDLARAVAVINRALWNDEQAGRLPRSPLKTPDPSDALPLQFHRYAFDSDGNAYDWGYYDPGQFRVENLRVEFVRTDVKAASAGAGATLSFEYKVDQVAHHPLGPLRFLEKHEVTLSGRKVLEKEQIRQVPLGQRSLQVKEELSVPALDARGHQPERAPEWKLTVHLQGIPPETRTVAFQGGTPPATTAQNCDRFKPLCREKCRANCLDMGYPDQWCQCSGTACAGTAFTIEQVKLECYNLMKARCEAGCTPKEKGSCETKARSVCRCHKDKPSCAPNSAGTTDGRWLARSASDATAAWLGWAVAGAVRPWLDRHVVGTLAEPCAGAAPRAAPTSSSPTPGTS